MKHAQYATRVLATAIVGLTTVALAGPSSAQTCANPPDGIVGWWPGDGNPMDIAHGHDATLAGGADFAPGIVGDAFSLNGVDAGQDDRVVLPHFMVDGLADLTIELWVNTTDTVGGLVSGANANTNGANEILLFLEATGEIRPWVKQRNAGATPISFNDGTWHHVAFTRSGGTGSLYVDGVLVRALNYTGGPFEIGPHGLLLGQDQDCLGGCFQGDQAFDGLMDEVSIYDRALSGPELAVIVAAGSAGKCKPAPMVVDTVTPDDLDAVLSELDAVRAELDAVQPRLDDVQPQLDALAQRLADLEASVLAPGSGDPGTPNPRRCDRSDDRRNHNSRDDRWDDDDDGRWPMPRGQRR